MKSKFCVLLVLIIIVVMLMTATTAMATRYFNVESVTGDLSLKGTCTFHLHGKRLCFDGPDLTLTFTHVDLKTWLGEAGERTGNTFLYRSKKDGEDYGFEWRMYKDKEECVIRLQSIDNSVNVTNDPTQDDYDSGGSFIVTFTGEFEFVELVFSRTNKKTGKPIGPGEWVTLEKTVTLNFTITLLEE